MSYRLLLALALLAAPSLAHAELASEFHGVRSLGMGGAHRGVGTSNDTLTLNPAGMAIMPRYAVEMQYGYSPFDKLTHVSASAIDSKSGPVAGAIGYTHDRGDSEGVDAGLHRFYLGAAYAISDGLAFGLTNRYVKGGFTDDQGVRKNLDLYTADIGLMATLAQGLAVGFSYNNIVRTKEPKLLPPTLGMGIGYAMPVLTLAADANIDIRRSHHKKTSYRFGAEYLLSAFPIRLGYAREPFTNKQGKAAVENLATGGIGWLSDAGGIDLAFRQSVDRRKNWTLIAAFRFFL